VVSKGKTERPLWYRSNRSQVTPGFVDTITKKWCG